MEAALAKIRQRFRERCAFDLGLVQRRLAMDPPASDDEFYSRIHNLAGMAGSIGYDRLSSIAIEVHETIRQKAPVSREQLSLLEKALAEVVASS